jgi:flagellar motility protein MotE (MotC chaperone)
MKALLSPIPALFLSLLLSVGGVYFWFQGQLARFVQLAAATRAERAEAARPEKPWDFWTPEMEQVARELAEQRTRFGTRESELAARESRLAEERKQIEEARRQVELLRAEIDSRLMRIEAEEIKNLKTLVATYSRLSPASAVAIFREMDDVLVAKLLSLMKPETCSAILEELSRDPGPENINVRRAAELTERLRMLQSAPPSGTP